MDNIKGSIRAHHQRNFSNNLPINSNFTGQEIQTNRNQSVDLENPKMYETARANFYNNKQDDFCDNYESINIL